MKLRFNRQEMADVLTAICSVAGTRSPRPVLKCVRVEAQSDVLFLFATDLELSLRCSVTQVEVDEPGETLVIADTLSRIVRECEDELLDIETVESMLHLRGVGSHFQIVTQEPGDFPPVPTIEASPDFTVEQEMLHRLVEWTIFASARESTRYAINGVLWEVAGKRLTLAATDGRRLSLAHGQLATSKKTSLSQAIVPTKALALLGRLPVDASATVSVNITDNQMLLKIDGVQISTSLVEGHFPKYQDVVPTDCDREIEVETAGFLGALKRAALLTNEESKGVRLSLSDEELTLSSRAPEQGEATVSLPIQYKGEPLEIGFNPAFLIDVLRIAHTDKVKLAFKESNRPGVLRLDDDFLYVVMPVNLASA